MISGGQVIDFETADGVPRPLNEPRDLLAEEQAMVSVAERVHDGAMSAPSE